MRSERREVQAPRGRIAGQRIRRVVADGLRYAHRATPASGVGSKVEGNPRRMAIPVPPLFCTGCATIRGAAHGGVARPARGVDGEERRPVRRATGDARPGHASPLCRCARRRVPRGPSPAAPEHSAFVMTSPSLSSKSTSGRLVNDECRSWRQATTSPKRAVRFPPRPPGPRRSRRWERRAPCLPLGRCDSTRSPFGMPALGDQRTGSPRLGQRVLGAFRRARHGPQQVGQTVEIRHHL